MRLMILCILSIFISVTGACKPQSAQSGKPGAGLTKNDKFYLSHQGSEKTGGENVPISESDISNPLNTDKALILWNVQHMRSYMAKIYINARDLKEFVKKLRNEFINATDTGIS